MNSTGTYAAHYPMTQVYIISHELQFTLTKRLPVITNSPVPLEQITQEAMSKFLRLPKNRTCNIRKTIVRLHLKILYTRLFSSRPYFFLQGATSILTRGNTMSLCTHSAEETEQRRRLCYASDSILCHQH